MSLAMDMDDEVCFCEYDREGDGERRHLLQFFCECDDLDRLADDWVVSACGYCCPCCEEERPTKRGAGDRQESVRKLFATIEDRLRVPWFGGARKVNAGVVIAPIILKLSFLMTLLSDRPSWKLLCLLIVGVKLVRLHLLCLRIQWRTDYFSAWILFSIWGIYGQYRHAVLPRQGWLGFVALHLLLACTLAAFALAILQRPTQRSGRSYACRVCAHQVHRRDHHCVWINQCVGSHNHRSFFCFTAGFAALCMSYACLAMMAMANTAQTSILWYLVSLWSDGVVPTVVVGAIYTAVGGMFSLALVIGQVSNIGYGLTTHECKQIARAHAAQGKGHALGQCRDWQRHPFDSGSFVRNWQAWLSGECYGDWQSQESDEDEGSRSADANEA